MVDIEGILSQNIIFTDVTVIQVLFALVILAAGILLSKLILRIFRRGLKKTALPELVIEFLGRFLGVLLYVIIILLVVGSLGIRIDSVVIGLSAVIGLILGFGMQDTLTNLAGGVWIAALRPIDKDEVVTINGMTGKVRAVGIMATELLTADNQFITIPNKLVWGSPIINATRMPTRRVDVSVGTSYEGDLDRAIRVAMDLMKNHSMVLDEPAPSVVTTELADSTVNIKLQAWSGTENYWAVKNDLTKGVFDAFRKEGIDIPYPQMDIRLKKE